MHIHNRLDIYKEGAVKKYIGFLTPKQFLQYIKNIRAAGFSSKIGHKANKLVFLQPPAHKSFQIINQLLAKLSSATTSQPI